MPSLELHSANGRRRRVAITAPRTVIGRHPDCDVVLDDASVSRQHAALTVVEGVAFIEDLRSRNGTLVNGQPLATKRQLAEGDEIAICGDRLFFSLAGRRRPRGSPTTPVGTESAGDVFVGEDSSAVIVSELDLARPAGEEVVGRQAEAKLRALLGINRSIGASLSLDEVLPRMLEGLLAAFPLAERAFVLLADPQSDRLVLRARRTKGKPDTGPLRLSLSLINTVAASRRAILSADAAADSRFSANESIVGFRIRSVMCVPVVRSDGSLLGVVQVDSRAVSDGFNADDLDVLAGVAGQAAQAIEQALAHDDRVAREQLDRDLELAHRVQQGLLPSRPPEIAGYEIFDYYEAARHVGGDFFGYVPLADDRMAVVLADVSGKGVAAALLMAALSADVRYCLASERDLGRAVARINESFMRGGWDDRFATLVVGVLDPATHRVRICNAGHLPVFLREAGGSVRTVAGDLGGLPLGMAAGREFRTSEHELAAGDTLVFCTDGISEALDHERQCYGLDRLERVLAEPVGGASDLGRRVLADVERHAAGQVRSDDMCLVCVGRMPAGPPPAHPAQKPAPARRGGRMQADP